MLIFNDILVIHVLFFLLLNTGETLSAEPRLVFQIIQRRLGIRTAHDSSYAHRKHARTLSEPIINTHILCFVTQ